ncbi:MAG: leucine-rich repeat domain-containing protein, partial [Lachnospiraceae bacterium]|nr:leucine-rich repeat domain-containing protein [Lachnospiraceae bacterium]
IGSKAFEDCVNLQTVEIPDSMMRISDSAFDGCPRVKLNATPGTYGAIFAAELQKSEVDEVEYEDVQDSQVIEAGDIAGDSVSTEDVPDEESEIKEQETEEPEAEEQETDPVDEEDDETKDNPTPEPTIGVETQTINNLTLLGQSSIVSGRAVIFIDNRQSNVLSGDQDSEQYIEGGRVDLAQFDADALSEAEGGTQEVAGVENLLVDRAQKGKDFPKYTIVGDTKIAAQAFYQNAYLKEYNIEDGITEIGEFAFARSGLTSVEIPEGVTEIGYGAFYHCDSLREVTIPSTVTKIDAYAFDKTPWIQDVNAASPYKIVGDGILIAYGGTDSVVNIPDGVKQIGALAFQDHMVISAVNIPASVHV